MNQERRGRPRGIHTSLNKNEDSPPKEAKKIFTDELAYRIYELTQHYAGGIMLADLRLVPQGTTMREGNYETFGFSLTTKPPEDWEPFYLSKTENFGLNKTERKNFSTALKIAIETGFRTIQDIRGSTVEILQVGLPGYGLPEELRKTKLSAEKAGFLKKAFGPENQPEQF